MLFPNYINADGGEVTQAYDYFIWQFALKLKRKKKIKQVSLSVLKKHKLDNLHRNDKEMGPPLDQLLFKHGSNSPEIFRSKY